MLTVRLLLMPFPLSNIPAALLIAFISLAYLEQDGLLLIIGLLGGCLLLLLDLGMIGQVAHWIRGFVQAFRTLIGDCFWPWSHLILALSGQKRTCRTGLVKVRR